MLRIELIPGSVPLGSGLLGAIGFLLLFIIANGAILLAGVACGLSIFSKKIAKLVLWTKIGAVFLLFFGVLFCRYTDYVQPGASLFGTLLQHLHQPPAAWLFVPFRAIADCALLAFQGWTPAIPIAFALWISLFILCQRSLNRFTPWMYEYAVHLARGNRKRREMRKQHSYYLGDKSEVREKTIRSRSHIWRWMDEWTPAGAAALFWRNLLLIRRFGGFLVIKVYIIISVVMGIGIAALRVYKPNFPLQELLLLGGVVQFLLIFAFVPSNIAWLSQTLKRFEIQKPLPIPTRKMVFAELLTPALAVALSNLVGLAVLTMLFPRRWEVLTLGYVTAGSGYMLMACLVFIILLFNPDQDDTLQRMLFGIYQLLVFLVAFLPAGLVIAIGYLLHVSPIVQSAAVLVVNSAFMYLLVVLAGIKYGTFNPID